MRDYVDVVGRLGLAILFAHEAYDTLAHVADTRAVMTQYGITWNQNLLLYLSAALLTFGSLMLALGYRSRLAAAMLLAYWLPVSLIVYSFWDAPADEARIQLRLLMDHFAIAGGLFLVIANGTGRFAVRKLLATARSPR